MNPLPRIDKAFSLVNQQEHELDSTLPIDSTDSAFPALHANAENSSNVKGSQFPKGKGLHSVRPQF